MVSVVLVSIAIAEGTGTTNAQETTYRKVSVRLEVRGSVVSTMPTDDNDPQSAEFEDKDGGSAPVTRQAKLHVDARFRFEELQQDLGTKTRAIRKYDLAQAEIELDEQTEESALAADNSFVLLNQDSEQVEGERNTWASLGGQLSQREWQLLETPASTLLMSRLIAEEELTVGRKWKVDESVLADFLVMDAVSESNVTAEVTNLAQGWVEIALTGAANGFADDVQTSARLSAKLAFEQDSRTFRKAEVTLRHRKDEGQIGPGFDVLIKMAIDATPLEKPEQLTRETVTSIGNGRSVTSDLRLENPSRSLSLLHSRQWRSVINSTELTVVRLLEEGQVMGQCNIIPLLPVPAEAEYPLEEFEERVQQIVGDSAKVIQKDSRRTPRGLDVYEIEVAIFESSVQLARNYFHVMDSQGNRSMLIFTTEAELLEAVRPRYRELVDAVELRSAEKAASLRKNIK